MGPKVPPAGERLRRVLAAAHLSPAEASKIAGYPYQSGLQHHLESSQPYFHPKVIERIARLVGHGTPPISEAQVQALAILPGQLSPSYPETQVTAGQAQGVPQSPRGAGAGEANTRGTTVEASLLGKLFEEIGVLKHRVETLEAAAARREGGASPANPRKAGKGR